MTCIEDKCERNGLCTNSGFTLAEVLITLGIIGVVAALTIPTLMQNLDRRDRVSKVKAAYSQLSQAMKMAEVQYGTMDKWFGVTNQDVFSNAEEYTKYGLAATDWVGFKYILDEFKTVKVCPHTNGCFPGGEENPTQQIKGRYLNGDEVSITRGNNTITVILANGMSMRIYNDNRQCNNNDRCASVFFDVMGSKKSQHIICKDSFEFNLHPNAVKARSKTEDGVPTGDGAEVDGRFSCTAYIIRHDNMDYLDDYGL